MNYNSGPQYSVTAEYPGLDTNYDKRIETAARRSRVGSGYSFFNGYRDVSFIFRSKEAANNAASRIRGIRPKKRGTRVNIHFHGDES